MKVNKNTRIKIASKLLTLAEELIKKAIDKRYQNPDGTFKVMTCPDNPKSKSKFCGCVRYQMAQGYSLERAKKICGKIKKMKYGGVSWTFSNIERICDELNRVIEKTGKPIKYKGYSRDYFIVRFYPEETSQFGLDVYGELEDGKRLNLGSEIIHIYEEVFGHKPERESMEKQSRRFGRPRTDRERLKRHKRLHPEDEVEDIEDLPPRGTGLKRKSAVDPYVDIDHVTDTFLEWAGNPRKGANLTDELIDYFAKYKVKMEHRKPLINNLKGMGYKVDINELKERKML